MEVEPEPIHRVLGRYRHQEEAGHRRCCEGRGRCFLEGEGRSPEVGGCIGRGFDLGVRSMVGGGLGVRLARGESAGGVEEVEERTDGVLHREESYAAAAKSWRVDHACAGTVRDEDESGFVQRDRTCCIALCLG